MRYFIVLGLVFAFLAVSLGNANSAGLYVVGKEPCDCSPLIARGIIPDPLNRLHDMLYSPQVAAALDSVAVEVRSMVTQLETTETNGSAPAVAPEEETKGPKEKPTLEEKATKEEGAGKEATETIGKKKPVVHAKKAIQKKKKKVKVPGRAM